MGSLTQSVTSRGYFNSSVLDNAQTGLYSATSRALAEVDENVGNLMAGLDVQQTDAELGALGAQASFYPQRSQAELASRESYINFLLDRFANKPQFGHYLANTAQQGLDIATLLATSGGLGGGGAAGGWPKASGGSLMGP